MAIKKKSLKSLRESAEQDLPTHASDAGVEIPDSSEKRGKRAVPSSQDGRAVAAASGQRGNAQGRQIPEEKEDELEEGADEDLPTHPSDARSTIPDKFQKEDGAPPWVNSSKKAVKEEDEDDSDKEVNEEDEDELKEEDEDDSEKEVNEEDEDELKEEDEDDSEKEVNEEDEDELKLKEEDEKEDEKLSEEEEDELKEEDEEELKKHVEALTKDDNLPESFKRRAATIFEAAVKSSSKRRTELFRKKLGEVYKKKLNKKSGRISEALTNKVDGYLDYVVEEWLKENSVAIETSLKTEIVEKFIHGLKGLFESHYIEVPATKTDVLVEQASKISGLEKELNETLNKNVDLRKRLISLEKQSVIKKLSGGLTVSESAKFVELCEGVSFESTEAFKSKLVVVKETYFPKTPKRSGDLDNDLLTEGGIQEPISRTSKDEIDLAVDAISRMVKK